MKRRPGIARRQNTASTPYLNRGQKSCRGLCYNSRAFILAPPAAACAGSPPLSPAGATSTAGPGSRKKAQRPWPGPSPPETHVRPHPASFATETPVRAPSPSRSSWSPGPLRPNRCRHARRDTSKTCLNPQVQMVSALRRRRLSQSQDRLDRIGSHRSSEARSPAPRAPQAYARLSRRNG